MKRWIAVWLFASGLVGIAQAQAPAAPAPASPLAPGIQIEAMPAMWQIKGAGGSVYLFGTIHAMRKEVHWETAKVKDALKSSDVLYLEIADIDPQSVQALVPQMMQMGMDLEHPLSSKISKEDVAILDAAAKQMGVPGEEALEPLKPWLVYLLLSAVPLSQAGYDPQAGIDQLLLAEAKTQKKPVKGFETGEQQMHYFSDFPQDEQVALLHQQLADVGKGTAEINDLVADWTHGQVDKIAALDNDEMKTKHPALYDKLLVKRNTNFAAAIAAILKDPKGGTVFVAVGAGHLAGPDSVIKMLSDQGFTISRVE